MLPAPATDSSQTASCFYKLRVMLLKQVKHVTCCWFESNW